MKAKFILWFSVLFLLLMVATGCEKEHSVSMPKTNKVAAIFELSYGQHKKITYGKNEKIEISLQNVVDSVDVNCAFVDFQKPEDALSVRMHAYLRINKSAELVKVSSKPCGAIDYREDVNNIQDVVRYIDEIIAAPTYQSHPSYFMQSFVNLFGEGTQGNRIKMSLPLRYGKDRLFLYSTGSSREGTLQAQVERHINHRYSYLSLWRRRLRIYV